MKRRTQQVRASNGGGSCPTLDGESISSFSLTEAWTLDDAGSPLEGTQSPSFPLSIGGSAPTYEVAGKRGKAIRFASDTHYYQNSPSFQPSGDFTFNIWINLSSVSTENRFITWSSDITSNAEQIAVYMNTSGEIVLAGDLDVSLGTGGSIVAGRWYMLTLLRSGTTWKVYLNRTEIITSSTQGSDDMSSWALYLGRKQSVYAPSLTLDAPVYYKAAVSVNGLIDVWANGNGLMINDPALPTISGGTILPSYTKYLHSAWKHDDSSGDLVEALYGVNNLSFESGTATYGVSGKDGNCISCVSDPIWKHTDELFQNIGTGSFSINCWVRITNTSGFKELWNITGGVASFSNSFFLTISDSETIWLRGDNGATTRVESSVLALNTWYMVTVVRNASNTELFLNGVSQGTTTEFNGVDISTRDFYLGKLTTNRGDGFDRDEMHLFSKDLPVGALLELADDRFVALAA